MPAKKEDIILHLQGARGLIRVSMAVDTKTRVINQILITGDFFAHPNG